MERSQTPHGVPRADQIARNVRAEMARRGVSQTALAEQLGWSQRAVSRRVTGETRIHADELTLVADALGVDVAVLLDTPAPAGDAA